MLESAVAVVAAFAVMVVYGLAAEFAAAVRAYLAAERERA